MRREYPLSELLCKQQHWSPQNIECQARRNSKWNKPPKSKKKHHKGSRAKEVEVRNNIY
jgi:hypothetical protein